MPENDITKLPKWAREEILSLRLKKVRLEEALRVEREKPDSPVRYRASSGRDEWVNIPEPHLVQFQLDPPAEHRDVGQHIQVYYEVDRQMLRIAGSRQIIVKPGGANVVLVKIDPES
jgi:hypothetical protein